MAIALPSDFPDWSTVRTYFERWKRKEISNTLNQVLTEELRIEESANLSSI